MALIAIAEAEQERLNKEGMGRAAAIEASAPVFSAVSAPMGNIDKVVGIEQGNGGGHQSGGVSCFASTAPSVIFGFLQQLDLPSVMKQLGIEQKSENDKPVSIERSRS